MKKALVWIRFIALVASFCMVIVAISFSWFTNDIDADVDSFNADAVEQIFNGPQIAHKGTDNWQIIGIDITNTEDIEFKPLVGNGQSFFKQKYKKEPVGTSNYSITVADGYEAAETSSIDYLTFDYRVRHKSSNAYLILDTDSYLRPASTNGNTAVNSKFSAGAMRVSFSKLNEESGEYEPVLIWIPNTEYQANGDSISTEGTQESEYKFRNDADNDVTTVTTKNSKAGKEKIDNVWYLWGNLEDIPNTEEAILTSFEANPENDEWSKAVEFRLNIWLDGEDRECTDAGIGGAITAMFNFKAVVQESE